MTINKANYENFVLDYLEGNLSASELTAMRAFLKDHPFIEAEILELQENWVQLEPDLSIAFAAKEQLLQQEQEIKVVWLSQKTFMRWASAAAAILLLLFGYGLGYFTEKPAANPIVIIQHDTIIKPVVEQIIVQHPQTPVGRSKKQLQMPAQSNMDSLQAVAKAEQTQQKTPSNNPENVVVANTRSLDTEQRRVIPLTTLPSKPILLIDENWSLKIPILSAEPAIAQSDRYLRITKWVDYLVDRLPFQDASKEAFVPSYFLETGE